MSQLLAELPVTCDFKGDNALEGCSAIVKLARLREHCEACNCSTTQRRVPTISSTVGEVLQSSPSKLAGDVTVRLASKLVSCTSEQGTFHQRAGNHSVQWVRQTTPRVPSELASSRTLRRRTKEIEDFRTAVSGGSEGSRTQLQHELRSQPRAERDELLRGAGLLPQCPESGAALAIKADLHLPWNSLRKLKRWFKKFGIPLESESTVRQQIASSLPFTILADNAPLCNRDGVVLAPVVRFPDLVESVLHYVNMHDKAGTLSHAWKEKVIPADEIWIKIGGDHGNKAFKLMFQIANVQHPNSLSNTIPFLVFGAKDMPANLQATMQVYKSQIEQLQATTWQEKNSK